MDRLSAPRTTWAILYPGEIGAALGKNLCQRGYRVITSLAGRSERTHHLSQQAGIEILPSLEEVAQKADGVISAVPPAVALKVAEDFLRARQSRPGGHCLFLDLNSVSPVTMDRIAALFQNSEIDLVDGAIHGLAALLETRGIMYLSGNRASEVAECFAPYVKVKVLGANLGQASAMRMMISVLTKGLIALFLEMAVMAGRSGCLEELLGRYREAYPGVMEMVDRLLGTYPQHAPRRAGEMYEVEQTMEHWGLQPRLVQATRGLFEELSGLNLAATFPEKTSWSVMEVLAEVQARGLLQSAPVES